MCQNDVWYTYDDGQTDVVRREHERIIDRHARHEPAGVLNILHRVDGHFSRLFSPPAIDDRITARRRTAAEFAVSETGEKQKPPFSRDFNNENSINVHTDNNRSMNNVAG